jgi:hypothetical protein
VIPFAALWLALAAGPGAGTVTAGPEGAVALATHRGARTFLFVASVASLSPEVRERLLEPALPEPLPDEAKGPTQTLVAPFQPLGTPFARWSGRRVEGFVGATPVCTKSVSRLWLLGAAAPEAASTALGKAQALARGVVAGELDDRQGACRKAEWFHDPDLGPPRAAGATLPASGDPGGSDEIAGGVARLRVQPEWVRWQEQMKAAHPAPRPKVGEPAPDAGPLPVSWDGQGASGVHFQLGLSAFVAAASASPDCEQHLALLFHVMAGTLPTWPYLSFDSPDGALPKWVVDVGAEWPVVELNGALLARDGDHYSVVQRFPGTPAPACPNAP